MSDFHTSRTYCNYRVMKKNKNYADRGRKLESSKNLKDNMEHKARKTNRNDSSIRW